LPVTIIDNFNAKNALAKRIASTIRGWIDNEEPLVAQGRPINAGDIMILVRSRNSLVDHLISALKSENVPVSGVDRMVISDQIAVQDIVAALSFAMMPDDDLNLASLLKSPFIGWDDAKIEPYAHGRGQTPLWTTIKNGNETQTIEWLRQLIETISTQSVFDAMTHILVTQTPNDSKTGWQAITSRLGLEAIDAVEELLSMAQNYDLNHSDLAIQGFLHYIGSDKRDLKRELESGGDMVRIMTVHASKGLQSPIVIMPDTTSLPRASGNSDDGFLWTRESIPLWIKSGDDKNTLYQSLQDQLRADDLDEYNRLLYVAMTRAEDRLIVCGHMNNRENSINDQSWYETVKAGLASLPDTQTTFEPWSHDDNYMIGDKAENIVFETEQIVTPSNKKSSENIEFKAARLPNWATAMMKAEHHPPKTMMPSKMDDHDIPVRSPLTAKDDKHRFKRGLLTHSLLQYLPNINDNERKKAAYIYLEKQAPDLEKTVREDIITECLNILNTPEFAPFFAEGSMAEIPVTGMVTDPKTGKIDIISGEIDRMVITDDTVWIIDYKSNRPPPKNIKNVQKQYIKQLYSYKTLVKKMYPNHKIRTALLWTDGPYMMEIKDEVIERV
jgi:ATP-dependent helicase/nuclease subunit A